MLRIQTITIRNFLSIGNVPQNIPLDSDGLTLVLGENLDVGGANSRNGVGKSAILQAICYALFGKPLTKVRLDNLVNAINGKEMLVSLDFECHGRPYRIERGRKPNVLRYYCDGVQEADEAQGENRRTQAEIERLLGMSAILFRHIVALNTFTTPFLREEAAVQREVIEELFGITQLSQRAETLKKRLDATKEQLRNADASVKANTEANSRIEQAIARAEGEAQAWQTAQQRRLNDLIQQAETLLTIDFDYEMGIFDHIDQWQEQKRDIDGRRQTTQQQIAALTQTIERHRTDARRCAAEAETGPQAQTERLQAEIARHQAQITANETALTQQTDELADLMARLDRPDSHTCTICGQGLAGTHHLATVIANLQRQQQGLIDRITRLLAVQDTLGEQVTTIETEITTLAAEVAERCRLANHQTAELEATIAALDAERQTRLADLQALPSPDPAPTSSYANRDTVWHLHQKCERLSTQIEAQRNTTNPFSVKIDGLRATLAVIDYTEVNTLTNQQKHEIFLHKLLTAKDSFVRKAILDQNLKYLNKRLDHYLQQLGLPHEVAFEGDLTVDISLLGASYDFEQLSRGEMNRIILATSWAFRDVWESLNTTLNLLFVDEMLDQGTDGAGVEAAVDILAQMAGDRRQSVFLVSHRDELRERIDNVLTVRKEQQFTSFAQ